MVLVDNGIYVDGVRAATPESLEQTFSELRRHGGMAWIGLYRPSEPELATVAAEFDLHYLAVEDALRGHQRAKLERYGSTLFTVLRPARYVDETEKVEFGELHTFMGQNFLITVRHAESPDLSRVRHRMEAAPDLLAAGPQAALYAVVDQVVDEYEPVVLGLENDVDEIEDQLFGGDPNVSRRIYELLREVIEFQRAIQPLEDIISILHRGPEGHKLDLEVARGLRDVQDHVIRLNERVNAFRAVLQNALSLSSTLQAQKLTETSVAQNEQVKRISSWAAILFAPTLVAAIYGMNFTAMPELHWPLGYPFALFLMVLTAFGLYWFFRHNKWL
ncbi:magnesium and cobalt transport protein CorA [Arthrobacter sulfonylureivorans]|uniref:Magnesium and cobalt transport protein CorA n=1 Tax=Arthrobacter sulfonylureivorans TaxID=2486855 RepID=A0ABY3WE61_9MICC|nr:magnesium and cobalt transport protein CorA [Arthrobacter sulfonylureivorans]UNK45979.1 magnesium and cobalt transport protein CorA [Arthrobacter sulfonylureivorans]